MKNKKILILLLALLVIPAVFSNPFQNSLLDLNYLTYKFLDRSSFESFNVGGPEMLVNKPKPVVGDEVRLALTDKNATKSVNLFLLSSNFEKKFNTLELSENTGLFFTKIKITDKFSFENLTFPFSSSKMILFYKSDKPYVYEFGEEIEKKNEEEKKFEQAKAKAQEEYKVQEQKSVGEKSACEYYRSEEVEGFSDYMFVESTETCEDLLITYKDQLFNKAKEVAKKQCSKIACVRSNCGCTQSFQEFPFEEKRIECMPLPVKSQTRLSYTIEGACICRC
ncbi:hypothetical protein HY837_04505 [archaeon]|nr:hypothetical protein [archaeon]